MMVMYIRNIVPKFQYRVQTLWKHGLTFLNALASISEYVNSRPFTENLPRFYQIVQSEMSTMAHYQKIVCQSRAFTSLNILFVNMTKQENSVLYQNGR